MRRNQRTAPSTEARALARLPIDDLLNRLEATAEGLSGVEAARRQELHGPNSVTTSPHRTSFGRSILHPAAHPLAVVLLVAGLVSALAGQPVDAALIASIVLVSAAINGWQSARSQRILLRLQASLATLATVRRDGTWCELPRAQLVPGDLVELSAGQIVPADARLLVSRDLHAQQASLTGESVPAEKWVVPGPLEETGPLSPAVILQGTSIVTGTAQAVVYATGRSTAYAEILPRLAERPPETAFERGLRHFGLLVLQTTLVLVLVTLAVNLGLGRPPMEVMLFSVALGVGLTPEFLPMISTVTLAQGARRMAREKVVVKHLSAIQNLGSIDVLCSDKTGTLTAGSLRVEASIGADGQPSPLPLTLAALNSRTETGLRSPLDAAILAAETEPLPVVEKTDELPFDFDRRRLSVVVTWDAGWRMLTKGAPENVLAICTRMTQGPVVVPLTETARSRTLALFERLGREGQRVLGVAWREMDSPDGHGVDAETELVFAGMVTFSDPPLPGAAEAIDRLRRDGVTVKLLSGDNEYVTADVAQRVGMDVGRVVMGAELNRLDEDGLALLASRTTVFARLTPAQKHRLVRAPVGVGDERLQQLPAAALEHREVDAHARAGSADQVVQHVGGDACHGCVSPVYWWCAQLPR